MKKWIAVMMTLALLLCLAACQEEPAGDDQVITRSTAPDTPSDTTQEKETTGETAGQTGIDAVRYCFVSGGVELLCGEAFDASALPEPASTYQVPSCAIEGTDNVYNYETFEVTAFNDGTGEVIYSIYLIDPNLTTPEGLALGDDGAKVTEIYGGEFAEEGTARIYTSGGVQLSIILQDDVVISIEYRLAV